VHIHILGICGTFMGSLAILARQLGHKVTGSDTHVYPPMSTQLKDQGIEVIEGYDPEQLNPAPDQVVVGNAMSRGNPCVEYVLEKGLSYTSGPQWLHDHVLQDRWVLAVAGTHGKTTTASMLAWILDRAGMAPGFLIGGVPKGFTTSARVGETPFFVIEADEYDTAFFDKRSKFVHYRPRTLIMNNLEYDHADIFPDLSAIQRQFHHLLRLIPASGQIICPAEDANLEQVLTMGCWSEVVKTGLEQGAIQARLLSQDGRGFSVVVDGNDLCDVHWSLTGHHNVLNGLNAMMAAHHVGVTFPHAAEALSSFPGVKRRMELLAEVNQIRVYDDFAHHPTAIKTTLEGARAHIGSRPLFAIIEPRSNTMRMGVHQDALVESVATADRVFWFQPTGTDWSLKTLVEKSSVASEVHDSLTELVAAVIGAVTPGTDIVIMSNGGFGGVHQKLIDALNGALK